MKSVISLFVFLLSILAFAEAKKDGGNNSTMAGAEGKNGTKAMSEKAMCREMARLEGFMKLVNNSTQMDKLPADKQEKIKAKATQAQDTLTKLQSNTTLTEACPAIQAQDKLKSECRFISRVQKMMADMNGTTTADGNSKPKKNNKDGANAQSKDGADAQNNNGTQHVKNATRIAEKMAKAEAKMKELMSNQTLVDACANLKQNKANSTSDGSSTQAAAASGSASAKSAAIRLSQNPIAFVVAFVAAGALLGGL